MDLGKRIGIIRYVFAATAILIIAICIGIFYMGFADDEVGVAQIQAQETAAPFMLVVEERSNGTVTEALVTYRILVDRETNVMYYAEYYEGYHSAGASITPLYNTDGTLRIYSSD